MRASGKPKYHVLFGDFMKEKNTTILKTWYSIFIDILLKIDRYS